MDSVYVKASSYLKNSNYGYQRKILNHLLIMENSN